MGFGLPAAIGAWFANPEIPVVNISGDGSFMMNMQEFVVAVENKVPLTVLVVNDHRLSMIRELQRSSYGSRFTSHEFSTSIDYVKLAEAMGGLGLRITHKNQVIPSITYYDFRYPGATNMLIATDEVTLSGSTETFQIMVPSTYFLYSRTWSHAISNIYDYGYGSTTGNIKIDDDTLNSKTFNDGWSIFEGDITPLQLYPDIYHVISLYQSGSRNNDTSFVGIVILYSQP